MHVFIKSFLQMCLYSNAYETISLFRNTWEEKHRVPDTCYINNDRANVITFMYVSSNWHDAKNAEIQTTSFSKESVENADLYKPVLNKIMTTYE